MGVKWFWLMCVRSSSTVCYLIITIVKTIVEMAEKLRWLSHIRLIGWLCFIVHSNYVNNKSKILVYFFHWWLWWRDWPSSPFFCMLSFLSSLFFLNYLKEMNASPIFQPILQWDGIWHNFFKWHILWVLTWSFLSVFDLNAFKRADG